MLRTRHSAAARTATPLCRRSGVLRHQQIAAGTMAQPPENVGAHRSAAEVLNRRCPRSHFAGQTDKRPLLSQGQRWRGRQRVFVLGDSFLPYLLQRFPADEGLIITDGSNSRGANFKRMIRPSGMCKHGWFFCRAAEQPYIESDGSYVVTVTPAETAKA